MTSNPLETAGSVGGLPGVPGARHVLASTDDGRDPRYAAVREAAARIAAASHGRVLLYHVLVEPSASGGRPRVFLPSTADDADPTRPHTGSRHHGIRRSSCRHGRPPRPFGP